MIGLTFFALVRLGLLLFLHFLALALGVSKEALRIRDLSLLCVKCISFKTTSNGFRKNQNTGNNTLQVKIWIYWRLEFGSMTIMDSVAQLQPVKRNSIVTSY